MKFKVPLYKQNLSSSCGASSMIMVENYYYPQKYASYLNIKREKEIHQRISMKMGDLKGFEDMSALAYELLKDGFYVRFYLEGPWEKIEEIKDNEWNYYLNLFKDNIRRIEKHKRGKVIRRNFNSDSLKKELSRGRVCIVETKFNKKITHIIVVRGYSENIFYIADPLKGYYKMLIQEMEERMDLGFLKNFFSVSK